MLSSFSTDGGLERFRHAAFFGFLFKCVYEATEQKQKIMRTLNVCFARVHGRKCTRVLSGKVKILYRISRCLGFLTSVQERFQKHDKKPPSLLRAGYGAYMDFRIIFRVGIPSFDSTGIYAIHDLQGLNRKEFGDSVVLSTRCC